MRKENSKTTNLDQSAVQEHPNNDEIKSVIKLDGKKEKERKSRV